MTDEELAWRQGIVANPGDDEPRLDFARVLEDYGQPERGEFIRVQCDIARNRFINGDPGGQILTSGEVIEAGRLQRRQQKLLQWFAGQDYAAEFGLPNHESLYAIQDGYVVPGLGIDLLFRRGFVHTVRGPLAAFWEDRECGECVPGRRGRYVEQPGDTIGQYTRWEVCPACHGTGRTSGVTPAFRELCRREPIEAVAVTDRRPLAYSGQYCWYVGNRPGGIDDRDHHVWYMADLPDYATVCAEESGIPLIYMRGYPTEAAAVAALSAAVIQLGRRV